MKYITRTVRAYNVKFYGVGEDMQLVYLDEELMDEIPGARKVSAWKKQHGIPSSMEVIARPEVVDKEYKLPLNEFIKACENYEDEGGAEE